jgi:hypothetical protein
MKLDADKVMRITAQAAQFYAGSVHFPENAPWLGELLPELFAFPVLLARTDGHLHALQTHFTASRRYLVWRYLCLFLWRSFFCSALWRRFSLNPDPHGSATVARSGGHGGHRSRSAQMANP